MNIQHSESLDQLALALSNLQGELPHVSKDSSGYGYKYADLASTLDVLKPLLVKHGFCLTQFGGDDGTPQAKLVTMLIHSSGQYLKGIMELIDVEMKNNNPAQSRGASLSYFRRYAVQAITGMASEDSDATIKTSANNSQPRQEDKAAEKKSEAPSRGSFRRNPTPAPAAAVEDLL